MKNCTLDLPKLMAGSRKNWGIEKFDVEAHLAGMTASTPQPTLSQPTATPRGEDLVLGLGRTRYSMWKTMVKSLEIPHFGYSTIPDLTELYSLLPLLNAHILPHYLSTSSRSGVPPPVSSMAILTNPPSNVPIPDSGQYTKPTYLPVMLKTLSRAMS